MKIHEYQGKQLLARYAVPVPIGIPALSVDEARTAVADVQKRSGSQLVVVKAQIHAGGRGKGGGVRVCKTTADAHKAIDDIFGMQLVTHQTGPDGKKVGRLLIEQGLAIAHEYYLGMTLDRTTGRVTVMASSEGGTEIEEVAARSPEKILKQGIHPGVGWQDYQARLLAFALGFDDALVGKFVTFARALVRAYDEMDCSLLEINPMIATRDGEVLALDAKVNFDDNALYRHPELSDWRDLTEEDPLEIEAKQFDLSYINLDGNIGCMVNGAGLAMSTMDIIKHFGGEPANFLDVGGGATAEKVAAAFKIITRDSNVKAIFVNIFGGIMKCDTIANGIISAVKEVGLTVPLVIRLEGTNVDIGRKLLDESGLDLHTAVGMAAGAKKAVELAGGELQR